MTTAKHWCWLKRGKLQTRFGHLLKNQGYQELVPILAYFKQLSPQCGGGETTTTKNWRWLNRAKTARSPPPPPLVWALLTASESNMRASSPANFGRTAACSTKTQHPGLLKDDTAALRVEACASDQDFKKKKNSARSMQTE